VTTVTIVPAATIRQDLPPYTRSGLTAHAITGAIRIAIGIDGRVSAASIEAPIDPRYDARLLEATRAWRYRPAMRDGTPIPFEKVVEIHVGGGDRGR
jgi:hypothetical protein